MSTANEMFDAIVKIAIDAGDKILAVYHRDFPVEFKPDRSPLTQADLAAHHHIAAALRTLSPDIPVLSEEAADIPFTTRRQWACYWLVDPLDGTKEFIKRNDEFTVNIALIENGEARMGVVHAPALNLSYGAARGLGAMRWKDGSCVAIRTRKVPARPVFVISKSHRDAALDAFLAKAPAHDAISRGSSLKFCQIAEGGADLYPRTGPTSEWDTAAGQCIVEQAGGQVLRTPALCPLRYNEKESLLNPDFLAIGDSDYGWPQKLA
ncbi:3'(2'),5'-bisphosphate nucleotidase CysQ [Solimonas terrae]|uniref:3'(2'),5'-bisphosphate nucleotidase CysQ n=1 Tax=Solimonas terrae TaxID=1396819 RepID=A0A6M2BWA7_9GAMM|nr:3'(2'),5'-bisphosphate nucleotidase CysQ [Solimonas terrae]NGY06684.1 3'(2'),5'-bisphosphate nucleotidase CysQ [Solimonas terrae]